MFGFDSCLTLSSSFFLSESGFLSSPLESLELALVLLSSEDLPLPLLLEDLLDLLDLLDLSESEESESLSTPSLSKRALPAFVTYSLAAVSAYFSKS